MARSRSPDREKAEKLYIDAKGNIKLKDIADFLKLPEGTIRGWKNKDHWDDKMQGTFQKNETKNTERSNKKKGGQPGNKNSIGHESSSPIGNKNAETHGFFSKYLPAETLDLVKEITEKDPLDILWENITIQYAAIIRAQRIMYVKDQADLTKELKRQKESSGDTSESWEKEYELQFAWDKHSTFLQAQTRAMSELNKMIRQYDYMLHANWDLVSEEQKQRIEKLKADIKSSQGAGSENDKSGVQEFIKATTMSEDEIKELFKGDADGQEENS